MNIIKRFKTKKSRAPTLSSANVPWHERLFEDAYTGWVVVLSVSILTALCLIALSGRLLYLVDSDSIAPPQTAVVPARAAFDPAALDRLVSSYGAKASATAALTKGYDGPPDPSR